jgi:hypothetical protein
METEKAQLYQVKTEKARLFKKVGLFIFLLFKKVGLFIFFAFQKSCFFLCFYPKNWAF